MAAIFRTHRRKFIAVGIFAGMLALPSSYLPNIFRTPGVQNIEARYSSGGGSKHHTPAAGTKRGHPDSVDGKQEGEKGIGGPQWQQNIGEQKQEGGKFDKAWNKAHYGAEKGK